MLGTIKDNEKGFILVLALVMMLVMTIIGISVVMNMTTDMQLSRNEREAKQAFQLAEAGIKEASARLHLTSSSAYYIGEKSTDANYRTASWNTDTPCSGKNIGYGCAGALASAEGLNYQVTIRYLTEDNIEGYCDSNNASPNNSGNASVPPGTCNKNPAEIVMYGQDFNLTSTMTQIQYGMLPVYKITSTGTSNNTSRTIVAYVGESNLNTDTSKAVNSNACIDVSGGSNTITGSVTQGPGCACDAQLSGGCSANKTSTTDMNTYLGDTLANIKTYADQVINNADMPASGKIDSVVSSWTGADPGRGVLLYVDNAGGKQADISGNVAGRGILIVTGDLKISGTVQWDGLIYVIGTLTVSGTVDNNGGIMANSTVSINGNVTVNYNLDILTDVSRQLSNSATISWKRM